MKDLTVFVLTHNRGELLLETIESILNQTCNDFKFIVSDNSSNDETMRLLEERGYLGKFEYRKRDKEYPSMEHFNLCLSEVDTTYFVLFHLTVYLGQFSFYFVFYCILFLKSRFLKEFYYS